MPQIVNAIDLYNDNMIVNFLGIGLIIAVFHETGNMPDCNDLFIIAVIATNEYGRVTFIMYNTTLRSKH